MSETIKLEEITGNILIDLNNMKSDEKGYESVTRAADMLLRHTDELNRRNYEIDKAKKEAEHAKKQLEFEKLKHEAELEQLKRQNDLKEFEINVAKWTAIITGSIGLAAVVRDVGEFIMAIKFEETGTFRSSIGKIALGRINKR